MEGRLPQESQSEMDRHQPYQQRPGTLKWLPGSADPCLADIEEEEKLRLSLIQGSQELSVGPSVGSVKHRSQGFKHSSLPQFPQHCRMSKTHCGNKGVYSSAKFIAGVHWGSCLLYALSQL